MQLTGSPADASVATAVDGLDELIRFVVRHTAGLTGMSITALSTLGSLADDGPLRITELALREGVTQPSMTTMVNRLERLGLVDRRPDPTDARGTLIRITEAGWEVRRRRRAARSAFLETLIHRLGPDDVDRLEELGPLLGRLADREALPEATEAARRAGSVDDPAGPDETDETDETGVPAAGRTHPTSTTTDTHTEDDS